MTHAQRLFLVAGIYGLAVILPQFFLEARVSRDYPPAITHPEYFHGFPGVATILYWQERVPGAIAGVAAVDLVLGVLFTMGFRRLGRYA